MDEYIKFESVEQFTPLIKKAAQLVAAEVVALRAKFHTLADVHRFFAGNLTWSGNFYRAAITAGLIGDIALARQLFARIKGLDPNKHTTLLKDRQAECVTLAALLDDPQAYRSAIRERIDRRRRARGFPPDPQCLEAMQLGCT